MYYYLIYISTAIKLMPQNELAEILTQSQKNNAANNLTGILMYSNGMFIQALEGEENTVNKTFNTIENDSRHTNIIKLISGEQEERTFPDWSMAFLALNPGKMAELEGYVNPLNNNMFKNHADSTVITIMKTFADNNNLRY